MKNIIAIVAYLLISSCSSNSGDESINRPSGDYVVSLAQMHSVNVGNGEKVYQAEGRNHDLKDLSFVITETQPGGGPPLHIHPKEEVHIVLNGKVTYVIADSVFTVNAPFIVKIPANTPHTFINSGDTTLNLIGVFAQDNFGPYKPIGKNPLIKS